MESLRISIVIPIYNVEKYLDRCIESVVNQTYKNLEIILVDDGSPDNCPQMCDDWAKRDNRIKVVHKKNEGLGMARNSGIDVATGKYIMFVDSDDYILKHACEEVVEALDRTHAQICCYGHINDYQGKQVVSIKEPEKLEYNGSEIIDFFLCDALAQKETTTAYSFISMSAWSALYDLSLIKENNIRFFSERDYLNEDLFFRVEICKYINKVVVLPENLYCYCHNGTSLTTSYREDRFQSSLRMYDKLTEVLFGYMDRADIANRCRRAFMNNLIVCLKQEIFNFKKLRFKTIKKKYLNIVTNEVVKDVINKYPIEKLPKQQKLLFKFIKRKNIIAILLLVNINDFVRRRKLKNN